MPENCEKCGKKILEKEQFYYDQVVNIIYCQNCESNIQNGLTHLIFFKSNYYNKEIINEFFQIKDKEPLKYRPFIQISYDKRYHYKTKNEKIENLRIKILIKERHKKIFTSNKEIKNIIIKLIVKKLKI